MLAGTYSDIIVDSQQYVNLKYGEQNPFLRVSNGFSNKESSLSLLRPIFDETDGTQKLIGVVGIDFDLMELKDALDTISDEMGTSSFPALVTSHGETIYHDLQRVYMRID